MKILGAVVAATLIACGEQGQEQVGVDAPPDSPVVPHALGFFPAVDIATTSSVTGIAMRDLNGDGKPDLAITTGTISVYLDATATGATTPNFAPRADVGTGSGPLVIGDFNGDGKPDIAAANVGRASVSVLLNTTAPDSTTTSFTASVDFTVGTAPEGIATTDINRDGKLDLCVANFGDGTASILLNKTAVGATAPTFAVTSTIPVGSTTPGVALGDIDADDKPDVALGNFGSGSVAIARNTTAPGSGSTSFAPAVDFMTGANPEGIAIADFDRDGRADLAAVNFASSTASVLLNATPPGGVPSFGSKLDLPTASRASTIVAGDLDGDGKPDLVVANNEALVISVYLSTSVAGAALASFAERVDITVGPGPGGVAIGDLNGDGKVDLAVAHSADAAFSILISR